jgi:hypothetical protein
VNVPTKVPTIITISKFTEVIALPL